MASQKKIQWDDVQYTIYNPPSSNLDLLQTRNEKYENIGLTIPDNSWSFVYHFDSAIFLSCHEICFPWLYRGILTA